MTRMSLRRLAGATVLLACVVPATADAADPDGQGPWADAVISANQGKTKSGNPVLAERSDPTAALGVAEDTDKSGVYYSLGFGGSIVLRYDNPICNGSGDDLDIDVVETTGPTPYPDETAQVAVSEDGVTWTPVGATAVRDAQLALPAGVSVAHYVKVVDTTDPATPRPDRPDLSFPGNADGYDVDGIAALHPDACKPAPTPKGLCELTSIMLRTSPAYLSLSPRARLIVDAKLKLICGFLDCVTPKLKPAQKAAYVKLYTAAVQSLAGPGWLSQAQVDTLVVNASQL